MKAKGYLGLLGLIVEERDSGGGTEKIEHEDQMKTVMEKNKSQKSNGIFPEEKHIILYRKPATFAAFALKITKSRVPRTLRRLKCFPDQTKTSVR